MNYKSTNIENLFEGMKNGVVTFEYTKRDGTVRTAKGTLCDEYLPEKIPDEVLLDIKAVDTLIQIKNIPTIEDYAKENGLKWIGRRDMSYVFSPLNSERNLNENQVNYYDIEKDHFRSFAKENFLGIVE